MPRPNRTVTTLDLGALRAPLLASCESRGVSLSEGLREIVARHFPATESAGASARKSASVRELSGVVDRGRRRVEIRLTDSEYEFAKEIANADGFALPRWIAAQVRVRIGGGQQLGERELKALAESSYQLRAIGRNLNQIARVLNADQDILARHQMDGIDELADQIESHLAKVRALLESNLERWKLEAN